MSNPDRRHVINMTFRVDMTLRHPQWSHSAASAFRNNKLSAMLQYSSHHLASPILQFMSGFIRPKPNRGHFPLGRAQNTLFSAGRDVCLLQSRHARHCAILAKRTVRARYWVYS
jgi:hypothetical protein